MHSAQFQLHADIEQRHWWFVARRRIVCRLIRRVLPPSKGTMVVDVGCGTGANIAALAGDYRCLGIDSSAEAVQHARQRFPAVEFLVGQAPQDLGPRMADARLVLLMDVLEHVPDDFAVLSALLAAATPGTLFLVTVPADDALWSPHDEAFGHYRRYDQQRLEQTWADLPVRPRLVSYLNARTYPLVSAVRRWNRLRGRSAGQAGTDFWVPIAPLNWALERIFAGEGKRLERILSDPSARPYAAGSSLVALVEREEGPITPRGRPSHVPADWRRPPDIGHRIA